MESTDIHWWSQKLLWRMFLICHAGNESFPHTHGTSGTGSRSSIGERAIRCFNSASLGMSLLAFLPSSPPFLLLSSFICRLMVYLPRGRATDSLLMPRLKALLCRNGVWLAFLKGSFRLNNASGVNERVKPARERGGEAYKSLYCESVFFSYNFV